MIGKSTNIQFLTLFNRPSKKNEHPIDEKLKQKAYLHTKYLKSGRTNFLNDFLQEEKNNEYLNLFFKDAVLIPCPRSNVQKDNDWIWPSLSICNSLIAHDFGLKTARILKRRYSIPKAAFAKPDERLFIPEIKKSLEVKATDIPLFEKIVIVDDVITQGRSMVACCQSISESLNVDLSQLYAFSVQRTVRFDMVESYENITKGRIYFSSNGKSRVTPEEDLFI